MPMWGRNTSRSKSYTTDDRLPGIDGNEIEIDN